MEMHWYWKNKFELMNSASLIGHTLFTYNAFQLWLARLETDAEWLAQRRWVDNAMLARGWHWWDPNESRRTQVNEKKEETCMGCGKSRSHTAHDPMLPPGLEMRDVLTDTGVTAHPFVGAEEAEAKAMEPAERAEQRRANAGESLFDAMLDKAGEVTLPEAEEIARRFIDGHFRNAAEHPRISIPATPTRDDDIRLLAFIRNVGREHAEHEKRLQSALIEERQMCAAILASARPNTSAEAIIERIDARIDEVPDWLRTEMALWMTAQADELFELGKLIIDRSNAELTRVPRWARGDRVRRGEQFGVVTHVSEGPIPVFVRFENGSKCNFRPHELDAPTQEPFTELEPEAQWLPAERINAMRETFLAEVAELEASPHSALLEVYEDALWLLNYNNTLHIAALMMLRAMGTDGGEMFVYRPHEIVAARHNLKLAVARQRRKLELRELLEKMDMAKASDAVNDLRKELDSMAFSAPEVVPRGLRNASDLMSTIANALCLEGGV